MATAPVKTSDISKLVRPRPPLKEAAVKLSFEVHPQSTKPGVRVFPPPVGGTLVERKSVAPAARRETSPRLPAGSSCPQP